MADKESIIIGGLAGTGSTTAATKVAEALTYEHVYAGGMIRREAARQGLALEAFKVKLAEDPEWEREFDRKLIERAKRRAVVLESRVLSWITPADCEFFDVWLTCDFAERVRRVQERQNFRNAAYARQHVRWRDQADTERYQKVYGVDMTDFSVFDLVIDTTKVPPEKVAAKVLSEFKKFTAAQ